MGILYVVQPIFSRILFKNRSTVKTATYELEFVKAKTCSGQIDHFFALRYLGVSIQKKVCHHELFNS